MSGFGIRNAGCRRRRRCCDFRSCMGRCTGLRHRHCTSCGRPNTRRAAAPQLARCPYLATPRVCAIREADFEARQGLTLFTRTRAHTHSQHSCCPSPQNVRARRWSGVRELRCTIYWQISAIPAGTCLIDGLGRRTSTTRIAWNAEGRDSQIPALTSCTIIRLYHLTIFPAVRTTQAYTGLSSLGIHHCSIISSPPCSL
ncbi:hypothetical protein L227DRAFT_404779 [Lentinus tigrinus ALCF2SS1-6]|uniref:Uncharacterized protein n=1 Tax=Lentinus tigrinus ALCF2SS1-6 TaxID=1328759 RepID=A0A5C2RPX8_9APHY|nr:hypothetical protein L227DRAFT_404779 [Lentinus tigrinus ALCF2SS1-6]